VEAGLATNFQGPAHVVGCRFVPHQDKTLQGALADHMSSNSALGDVLGLAAALVRNTAEVVVYFKLPDDVVGNLQRARVHGKRAIGVNFAMKEIGKVPLKPELIPAHACSILTKLAARGIAPGKVELPGFLSRVLLAMKEEKPAPAAPKEHARDAASVAV
jgi:hypothetical protein